MAQISYSMSAFLTCCLRMAYLVLLPGSLLAQQSRDSIPQTEEVQIHLYPSSAPQFPAPSSVSIISEEDLGKQLPYSLVPALNAAPGVRMEERSPGSYRLSVRGSLLRSPFGIRNIKIYADEFPFTDAGGNSYLNSFDASGIQHIEILKGPEGSLFGSNTGGVVRINPPLENTYTDKITAAMSKGSYGLFHEHVSLRRKIGKYQFLFAQSYQKSEGYRAHSAMQRATLQTQQQWHYSRHSQLRLFGLYSNLQYETPGGLTLAQFNKDPRAARPATATLPGAIAQKAAVYNKNAYLGILHERRLSSRLRHLIALSGNHTDFKNPFITNYEERRENTLSLRTWLELQSADSVSLSWKWHLGMEGQHTWSGIRNYGNRSGNRDTIQASNDVRARQYFFFSRYTLQIGSRWILEAALSLNDYGYTFRRLYPFPEPASDRKNFSLQLMPRIAGSWKIHRYIIWRASAGRGYSPPTIAEVRPSNEETNTLLQPEHGWNYETGFRIRSNRERFGADVTLFYFHLKDAIVRRSDANGNDFYVNAGTTRQPGMESQLYGRLLSPAGSRLIQNITLRNSFTWYDFSFGSYLTASADYSGNRLTGVPRTVLVTSAAIDFPYSIYLFIQHNFTSRIALNDAGTAYAGEYHLIQLKAGYTYTFRSRYHLLLTAGIDNLLNRRYSLGNDLNAVGGRYYNAAPGRNFYAGITVKI